MIEVVKCPNCECDNMDCKEVFHVTKPKVVSMEEDYHRVMSRFNSCSSGDMSLPFFGIARPIQVVYSCRHCGYTKVFEVEKK